MVDLCGSYILTALSLSMTAADGYARELVASQHNAFASTPLADTVRRPKNLKPQTPGR
jgi:hypothetical protein